MDWGDGLKQILKEGWRLIYPVLIYFAAAFVVEAAFLAVYAAGTGGMDGNGIRMDSEELVRAVNENSLYITLLLNVVLIPVFFLCVRGDERKRLQGGGKRYACPGIKEYFLTAVLGMASAVVVNVAVSLSGIMNLSPKYQQVSEIIYTGNLGLELVSAVIAAPLLEELLFRGLIFKRLRGYLSPVPAIVISAAVFGLFHGNLVQFVYAFIIGVLLGFVYEKYKTVWAPVAFHVGANFLSVLITELLPQRYMTVVNVVLAMAVSLVIMVYLIKYMSKYKTEAL